MATASNPEMKTFLRMRASRGLFSLGEATERDPEGQRLIQTLDEIRTNLQNHPAIMDAFEIPCVVVIGDQSAGKSSFVQALTGVPLPRASGLCTTRPLEIRMREQEGRVVKDHDDGLESKDDYAEVTVRAKPRNRQETALETKYPGAYDIVDDATALERLEDVLATLNNSDMSYCEHPIILEVSMPKHIALTIVDLPGLVSETFNRELQKIYDRFLNNRNAIIVPVVSSLISDIATTHTVGQYIGAGDRSREALRERMIGVVTQLDRVADRTVKERAFELLAPRAYNNTNPVAIPRGYYVVKCPGPGDAVRAGAPKSAIFSAQGRDFSTAVEMERFFCDQWIEEYLNFDSPTLPLKGAELRARFGRANVRQAIRERLIRLSTNALAKLPAEVARRLKQLEEEEKKYPPKEELAHRQKILAAKYLEELHKRVEEIRPCRNGFHQGLALIGEHSVSQMIARWDEEFTSIAAKVHVFLGKKLLASPPDVPENFERACRADRSAHHNYAPKTIEDLERISDASADIRALSIEELHEAEQQSIQLLADHLARRFDDGFVGFLEYSSFESFLQAVLVTVTEYVVGYIRKYACLCGYILDTMVWDLPADRLPQPELYTRLKERLKQRFEEHFQAKLEEVIRDVKMLLRTAFSRRLEVDRAVQLPVLSGGWDDLQQQVLAEMRRAMMSCVAAGGQCGHKQLLSAQEQAVAAVFARHARQEPMQLVEKDARAYLRILDAHWQSRGPSLFENVRDIVHVHLVGSSGRNGGDSFVDYLRRFELRPGDEKEVEDDSPEIIDKIDKIEKDREALVKVHRTLGSALRASGESGTA